MSINSSGLAELMGGREWMGEELLGWTRGHDNRWVRGQMVGHMTSWKGAWRGGWMNTEAEDQSSGVQK